MFGSGGVTSNGLVLEPCCGTGIWSTVASRSSRSISSCFFAAAAVQVSATRARRSALFVGLAPKPPKLFVVAPAVDPNSPPPIVGRGCEPNSPPPVVFPALAPNPPKPLFCGCAGAPNGVGVDVDAPNPPKPVGCAGCGAPNAGALENAFVGAPAWGCAPKLKPDAAG